MESYSIMSIQTAIELNIETKYMQLRRGEVEHAKATQMGIEALKYIRQTTVS